LPAVLGRKIKRRQFGEAGVRMSDDQGRTGSVGGLPRLLLRGEGLAAFLAALALYEQSGASWWLFAVLILVPDLSMAGYLAGPRIGAVAYNGAHTYAGPAALAALDWMVASNGHLTVVAIVWFAHIGFDRALGYGLKYASGFRDTHLGRIGREPVRTAP
jgi:Domain of unknown function (DUF4260)